MFELVFVDREGFGVMVCGRAVASKAKGQGTPSISNQSEKNIKTEPRLQTL